MAAREEDKAMAGLLRRSLAQDAGAGSGSGGDCPEPEVLAAYFDHALDAQETARYDLHFSRCSVCREQLAAMARAGDAFDAKDAEKKNAGAWGWLAGPRWLMPAAAMLVALLVFVGIALRMKKMAAPAREIAMSRTDAVPSANTGPSSSGGPSPSVTPPAPEATDLASVRPAAPRRPDAAGAPPGRGELGASRPLDARTASRARSGADTAAGRGGMSSDHAGTGMAPAERAAIRRQQAMAQEQTLTQQRVMPQQGAITEQQTQIAAPRKSPLIARGALRGGSASASAAEPADAASANESVVVSEAAPTVDTMGAPAVAPDKKAKAESAGSGGGSGGGVAGAVEDEAKQPSAAKTKSFAKEAAAPARPAIAGNLATNGATGAAALAKLQEAQISSKLMNLQIQTPDPKILWMVASPGVIEKSEDGGTTWKPEYVDTRALLLAGAAPTVRICWVVGANGTILRTTNGSHWRTIRPPVETNFVRVEAADASSATVTAMDGRKFATADGGKSWSGVK
jgi:hypothetical protein